MKRPANQLNKRVKRTLWRNTLMGIIGLTMSACGLFDQEPKSIEPSNHGSDVISAAADTTEQLSADKKETLEALKRELDVLRKKVAEAQSIEPPTLNVAEKKRSDDSEVLTIDPKPGKLKTHEAEGNLGVVASAMALGVDKRIPLGVGSKFNTDAEKIWAFIKVKNKKAPTKLRMVWKRQGKQRMAIDLRVGKSSGWRTWSYKRIGKRDAGKWTVEVFTQEGEKIHTMAFEVKEASVQTDLAEK